MFDGFVGDGFAWDDVYVITPYATMLTIEDGTIVSVADGDADDADSYVTIADVTTYAGRYGATWDTASPLANEQAILRGMLYIESFEPYFAGARTSEKQVLSWPRAYVTNAAKTGYLASNVIPAGLKNAVCEAAILEMATPGLLLESALSSSQTVKRLFQKIAVLEKETEYFEGSTQSKSARFEKISAWLRPFINANNNVMARAW